MPFHKHSTSETGHGFFTSTIHSQDAFRKGITFIVKYLGSISIPKPKNRFEIIAAMNQARTEFRSNDLKKTKVVVRIGVEGIKVKLWSSKKKHTDSDKIEDDNLPLILHHSMFRIYYVTLDSYDLKIFSYFARDSLSDNRFRCNVFKSFSKNQAMHVVRTIGQAFEVCNKFKDSTSSNHFVAEDDAEVDDDDDRPIGSRSIGSNHKKLLRTRSRSVNGHDGGSVTATTTKIIGDDYGNDNDDSQDSDQSLKDISNDFKNFKMGQKLKTKSKSVEKLSCLSTGNQTYRQLDHNSEMFYNGVNYKNANSLNDFLRQNSLPSVTINDDNLVQYKTSNYEWLLINAKLEHEIQETQAAFSQIKLLQNQLQAEKTARLESQNLINHLLGQNRELLAHISTLIQQLNSRASTDRCSSKDKSRSPRPSDDSEPSPGTNFKYLTLPSKSSSSSSSPLFNHSNSPKVTDTLPKLRKNRSLTRDRTIIEEDFNNSSNLGSITRSFSEKLPQRNTGTLSEAQRIQWARHTTK